MPGRSLRGFWVAVTAGVIVLLSAAPAGAHALAQHSDPGASATVKQSPSEVDITFGETPDLKLSKVRVLDSSGQNHANGRTGALAGDPKTLQVAVGHLSDGVYTVAWQTVSRVDGHLATGTFAFGVGVGVAPTAGSGGGFTTRSPIPSTPSVMARWLLYAGLMGLVGGAFLGAVCYRSLPRRLGVVLVAAWALGAIGTISITADAQHAAHQPWSQLWGSSLGDQLAWRIVPLIAALVFLGLALRMPAPVPLADDDSGSRENAGPDGGAGHHAGAPDPTGGNGSGGRQTAGVGRREVILALAGLAALGAMWGDVEASHASASHSLRLLRMVSQWAHFMAAGIWVGGLVALLATLGCIPGQRRRQAVARFSLTALICVLVIAGTGLQRGYDEVGSLHRLFHSGFGQYVVIKIALLGLLIGLGAVNRYRSVPAVDRSSRLLHLIGRTEVILFVGVLAATGIIQGLAPPASLAAPAAERPLVLNGQDFGTTVRIRLSVTPDTTGFNHFTLSATDYDSRAPVDGSASLAFRQASRPDLGTSSLTMTAIKPGLFSADGANLSIGGIWNVVVTLQRAGGGVQIPLVVTLRQPLQRIQIQDLGSGLPSTYTLELAGNQLVQTDLDPGQRGSNEFHLTFIGANRQELFVPTLTVVATPPKGEPTTLPLTNLDNQGHYSAHLRNAIRGTYQFHMAAITSTGVPIEGTFTIPVK